MDRFAPEQTRPTELQLLQTMWEETSSQKKAAVHKIGTRAFHLWEAENPTEEVRQLAVEIRRLVSEENYRYRDIQVLTKICLYMEISFGRSFKKWQFLLYR